MLKFSDAIKQPGIEGYDRLPKEVEYYVDFYKNVPDFDDLQGWNNIISRNVNDYMDDIEKVGVILALKPSSLNVVIDYSDYTDFKKLIHDMLSWTKLEGVKIE